MIFINYLHGILPAEQGVMGHLLLTLVLLGSGNHVDTFSIQTELQALYDEISEATLAFVTPADVDDFHDVLYTADFTFTDGTGQKKAWSDLREIELKALSEPNPDWLQQTIRRVTPDNDGVTVLAGQTTLRTVVSDGGHPGRPTGPHTVTETTVYRDRWIKVGDSWKMQSREQVGKPTTEIDKPEE
jgi:hypothetical protein